MRNPLRIGVIGYGYWGPNLARAFAESPGATLAGVADLDPGRLALVARRYPGIACFDDGIALAASDAIDAVVVATPVSTHHGLALAALRADKHVMVEKPLASNSDHAAALVDEAERRQLTLMVDHTFVYTGAVRKIRELLDQQQLGRVHYYDSVRINLGVIQSDVNVVWDLATHDLAILDYLFDDRPVAVSAIARAHVPGQPENMAYVTLIFADQLIAHLHVNWLAPVKVRRILIGGDNRMISYDDVEPSEKVKIYDRGATVVEDPEIRYKLLVSYRSGDVWAPRLETREALAVEAEHFVECIVRRSKPLTDGMAGLRVVRTLEAADRSIRAGGTLVPLS